MIQEIKIKVNDFEGPLDLLLHLVNQYKVDISEVPLLSVIEQYLEIMRELALHELDLQSEYMLMASQLMLIKSRRLLPTVTEEYQEDTELLEAELLAQIDEYRKFKLLSQKISELHELRSSYYSKEKTAIIAEDAELISDKSTIDLYLAFQLVLERHKSTQESQNTKIEQESFSIEDKIDELSIKFDQQKNLKFTELFAENAVKEEIVTIFMALLELIKNQKIAFQQEKLFDEIILTKVEENEQNRNS